MQKLTLLTTLSLFLIFLGCAREEPDASMIEAQAAIQEAQDRVAAVEKEIALEEAEVEFRGNTVVLPDGSTDGDLAAAIAQAGNNGTVIVASGDHYETGTVMIDKRVRIVGEPGAVLTFSLDAFSSTPAFGNPQTYDPALYIDHANRVRIENLTMETATGISGLAILVSESSRVFIRDNVINGYQSGIVLAGGDEAAIIDNTITSAQPDGYVGILPMDGEEVFLRGNVSAGFLYGIFLSDRNGLALRNEVHDCPIGIIFCTFPNYVALPNGTPVQAPESANNWIASGNQSSNNFWGYMVIDGAFENLLVQNGGENNALYDVELFNFADVGQPELGPPSYDNTVISLGRYSDLVIKDCGINNTVIGGQPVDPDVDPCI